MKSLLKKYKDIVESYIKRGDVIIFWREQQALAVSKTGYEDDLSEYDRDFFIEAFEMLYYTDWNSPADEYLHEPSYLMEWMKTNYPKYLDKTWTKPALAGPRWVKKSQANTDFHVSPLGLVIFILLLIVLLIGLLVRY